MTKKRKGRSLEEVRGRVGALNRQILRLLQKRARTVLEIGKIKERNGSETYDPHREMTQLLDLTREVGPYAEGAVTAIFNAILQTSRELIERGRKGAHKVRRSGGGQKVFEVRGVVIGRSPVLIAGPCAIESESQLETTARHLSARGVRILRGGAHKPRTSPYSYQGCGDAGYRLLAETARRHGMACVSEVLDERGVAAAAPHVDILQIGMRNMANYSLLKAVREIKKPVLLKRGHSATLDELLLAAEYLAAGTDQIVLCERGIRTFEPWTRNTLDISAVPLLRAASHLPVCVDISHAAGRTDILDALARASFAAGAHAVMVEVHPEPRRALSDSQQQLSLPEFDRLLASVGEFLAADCQGPCARPPAQAAKGKTRRT